MAAAGSTLAASAEIGIFCRTTEAALRGFQQARGLHVTGYCEEETWRALVEASWKLGDRLLVFTSPNQRGDDIGELQGDLARLGFDCGRVDGIFGPHTSSALEDFQSNCGLNADGVCGPVTVRTLNRVIGQTGTGPGVAAVRERERLRQTLTGVASLRVVVGQFGGLSSITRSVSRELRLAGAHVVAVDEPDAVAQARAANQFLAQVYLGFEATRGDATTVHFYRVPTFESVGGSTLASCLTDELRSCGLRMASPCGMRLPVLRETRMPAVLCSVAPVRPAVDAAHDISLAVLRAMNAWTDLCTLAV